MIGYRSQGKLPPSLDIDEKQQVFEWFMKPLQFLSECQRILGDAFTLHLDNIGTHVFFANPNTISNILKADPVATYQTNDKEFMSPLLGKNSLFLLHSTKHLERRRILAPPFHAKKVQHFGQTLYRLTMESMQHWPVNKKISLLDKLFDLSLNIIFDIIFGLNNSSDHCLTKALITSLLQISRSGAVFIGQTIQDNAIKKIQGEFFERKARLDALLIKFIEEKRAAPGDNNSILSLLLQTSDMEGNLLSTEEIRDHLMTLLVAGHETTATSIAWAIYWVHLHPEIKLKISCEPVDSTNVNQIAENEYLHAICQETLRIIPIIAVISRTLKIPVEHEGFYLPPGVHLSIPIFLVHRNPSIYLNPEAFNPERFLQKKYSFYEYLPFGGGSRMCIGMGLALYQMKIVLLTLLSHFDIELLSSYPPQVIRKSVVMAPGESLPVKLFKKTVKSCL